MGLVAQVLGVVFLAQLVRWKEIAVVLGRVAVGDFLGGPGDAAVGKRSSRLPSLTGLRFVAALLVFVYHVSLPIPELRLFADDDIADGFHDAVSQAGELAVGFFFVLSGFLLTWSAWRGDTQKAFWRRRFVKIFPNYVLAAAVLFAIMYTPAARAVADLFLVEVWLPDTDPGWSLGAVAFFYASFPLLYVFARRIPAHRLKFWLGGLVALIVARPVLFLPPDRILDFALGILVARAVMTGRWRDIGMVWSGVLVVAGYLLSESVPFLYGQSAFFIIPAALLVTSAAIADTEGRFTLVSNPVMTWLGELSFAFYLMHFVVLAYGRSLLDGYFSTSATVGLLFLGVVVTVAASWVLYSLVERPVTHRWSTAGRKLMASEALH